MAASQPFAKLAAVGGGVLLGQHFAVALFATVGLPVGEAVEALFHLGRWRQRRRLCLCIAQAIAADMGRIDAGTLGAAREEAERLLRHHGPDERAYAEMGFDPAAATRQLMHHARFELPSDRREIAPHCERLLLCFYTSLSTQPELLADVLPHLHAAHFAVSRQTLANTETILHLLRTAQDRAAADTQAATADPRTTALEAENRELRQIIAD
jgi:hypothetical protein